MKIRPGNQKKAIFFTIGIFWIKGLILNGMFVMNAKIYQRCLWTLAVLLSQTSKGLIIPVLLAE